MGWKRRRTHTDKSRGLSPNRLAVSDRVRVRKRKEQRREGPVCGGSRELPGPPTVVQEQSWWRLQLAPAWPPRPPGDWVLSSTAFLCHGWYHGPWRFHFFFIIRGFLKDSVIPLKISTYIFYVCSPALKKITSVPLSFG